MFFKLRSPMRPLCSAIFGSITSRRSALRRASREPVLEPLCAQGALSVGGPPQPSRPLVSKSALCASPGCESGALKELKARIALAGLGQNLPSYSKWPLRLALVRR
jgi:hypothetical protein